MKIDEIRIYAEVLEQGLDFKEYICNINNHVVKNIYTKKGREEISSADSLITRIRKCKDVDVLISIISNHNEYPLLMVEYSSAVPTDDHKMQRSDVYYWSAVYRTPMMKICPVNKGMGQRFGGGDKFTDEYEIAIANSKNAIFFPIQWSTLQGTNTLKTKGNALSCIYYSIEIHSIIKMLLNCFEHAESFDDFHETTLNSYREKYSDVIEQYNSKDLKSVIVNSTRFKWLDNKLVCKINRFGHAMDPDRGVLYFANMLVGAANCITEIQVNRPNDFNVRGGYRSLFDATAHKDQLLDYIRNLIINNGNIFSPNDAIYIVEHALNIEKWHLFKKVNETCYVIEDDILFHFLVNNPSMTSKCIFFLSCTLILTDKNRNEICKVSWSNSVINNYLSLLYTANYVPTQIKGLEMCDVKEDLITFASVELYKKIHCNLAAVSYPGAQGDRCVLLGGGRTVKRTYIDIIAVKKHENLITVFLEECKSEIKDSISDVAKLNNFISNEEQLNGLVHLLKKTNDVGHYDDLKISVGAKLTKSLPNFDIDYVFMFSLNPQEDCTLIEYTVAVVDTSLITIFKPLMDENKKLRGQMNLDKIYIIK